MVKDGTSKMHEEMVLVQLVTIDGVGKLHDNRRCR